MLGYGVGVIGLRTEDFLDMTPEEFEAVATAYEKRQEEQQQTDWERMRLLATIGIQPHITERMTPQRLLPFPWDRKNEAPAVEELTVEQRRQRAQEFLERVGG